MRSKWDREKKQVQSSTSLRHESTFSGCYWAHICSRAFTAEIIDELPSETSTAIRHHMIHTHQHNIEELSLS